VHIKQIRNTQLRYGSIAILLHWLMAMLIFTMLGLGLYMTSLTFSLEKLKLYGWHKQLGILILMLVTLRIIWRLANINPGLPLEMPQWQKLAARGAHLAFYGFMVVMPITGWFISSAAGLPVSFFGLFVLPSLIPPDENLRALLSEIHKWLAYALIATICAHVAAALQHHFINKDDTLRKML
jgi:cytochrome b561